MKWAPIVLGLLALAGGYKISDLRPIVNPAMKSAGLEVGEKAAGASLLQQFRTSAAASLYERADMYLHGGVELRPKTEAEKQVGKRGSDLKPGEQQVLGDESRLVTSVPSQQEDFRGVLGDLERETTAYKDMHNHTHNDAETTFPLFRLMTWVDPQFIDGWTIGSMLLTPHHTPEENQNAMDFLQNGLKANPDSIEILTEIGVLETRNFNDVPKGLEYFERAHSIIMKHEFVEDQMDEVNLTYHWLLIAGKGRDWSVQSKIALEGLKLFPDDLLIERSAGNLGLAGMAPERKPAQSSAHVQPSK